MIGGGRGPLSASRLFPVNERRSNSDIFGNGSGSWVYGAAFKEVADEFAVMYSLVDVLGLEDVYVLTVPGPVAVFGRVVLVGDGLFFLTSLPREWLLDLPPGDSTDSGPDNIEFMISSEVKYSWTGSTNEYLR